jgi:hypothetical protein
MRKLLYADHFIYGVTIRPSVFFSIGGPGLQGIWLPVGSENMKIQDYMTLIL